MSFFVVFLVSPHLLYCCLWNRWQMLGVQGAMSLKWVWGTLSKQDMETAIRFLHFIFWTLKINFLVYSMSEFFIDLGSVEAHAYACIRSGIFNLTIGFEFYTDIYYFSLELTLSRGSICIGSYILFTNVCFNESKLSLVICMTKIAFVHMYWTLIMAFVQTSYLTVSCLSN